MNGGGRVYRSCTKCGYEFYADADWKRICIACWRASKNGAASSGNERALVDHLRSENAALRAELGRAGMPNEMLDRMIRLCHPDRHGNSAASNEVTAWLLNLRRTKRGDANARQENG